MDLPPSDCEGLVWKNNSQLILLQCLVDNFVCVPEAHKVTFDSKLKAVSQIQSLKFFI